MYLFKEGKELLISRHEVRLAVQFHKCGTATIHPQPKKALFFFTKNYLTSYVFFTRLSFMTSHVFFTKLSFMPLFGYFTCDVLRPCNFDAFASPKA